MYVLLVWEWSILRNRYTYSCSIFTELWSTRSECNNLEWHWKGTRSCSIFLEELVIMEHPCIYIYIWGWCGVVSTCDICRYIFMWDKIISWVVVIPLCSELENKPSDDIRRKHLYLLHVTAPFTLRAWYNLNCYIIDGTISYYKSPSCWASTTEKHHIVMVTYDDLITHSMCPHPWLCVS